MNEQLKAGFVYAVEVLDAAGDVVETSTDHNLMPAEGIAHTINTLLKGGAPVTAWYVGLFEGNYTPAPTDTAATLPAAATECTAFSEATRAALALGAISGGAVDNASSKAEFTFPVDKTIYGGFISSASAKGSTSGVLLSIVRFGSPKVLSAGSTLRITAGLALASL